MIALPFIRGQLLEPYLTSDGLVDVLGSKLVDPSITTQISRNLSNASLSGLSNSTNGLSIQIPITRSASFTAIGQSKPDAILWAEDLLSRLLEPDRDFRITAASALKSHPFLNNDKFFFNGTDYVSYRRNNPKSLFRSSKSQENLCSLNSFLEYSEYSPKNRQISGRRTREVVFSRDR